MTVEQLNERFGISSIARFESGRGGLTRLVIHTDRAEAEVYLLGAHVTHFKPAGADPVLWMSRSSWFEEGKPIRGGVPVCYPWFGATGPTGSEKHGLVRQLLWAVESVERTDDGDVEAVFMIRSDQFEASDWIAGRFDVRHRVRVGSSLKMRLETRNTGDQPVTLSEALHTYLAVSDVRHVSIRGLEQRPFLSSLVPGGRGQASGEPIRFDREVDRIYTSTPDTCVLEDPDMGRSIVISKSGSMSTVVWNPWVAKAAAMPDFGDDAITVEPGGSHAIQALVGLG